MQLHGPSEPIDSIPVEPYGTSGNVALKLPAHMWLVLTSPQDADRLIIAATQAKDLMLVTQPENDQPEGVPGWNDPLPGEVPACDCLVENSGPRLGGAILGCPKHDPERAEERRTALAQAAVTPFPHLAEHTHGSNLCNLCGIDHDAAARLAPPAGVAAIDKPLPHEQFCGCSVCHGLVAPRGGYQLTSASIPPQQIPGGAK